MTHENAIAREPMFNVLPLTMAVGAVLAALFLGGEIFPRYEPFLVNMFGFVPRVFGADPSGRSYTLLSYALLHFGWAHFGVNIFGLLAFGSGVERLYGKGWFVGILLLGTLAGAAGHWCLFPNSMVALGGASAGISALFGAALPTLMTRRNLWGANVVFVLTNIVIGMMGVPGNAEQSIAWQAHLFGFFTGEIMAFVFFKINRFGRTEV